MKLKVYRYPWRVLRKRIIKKDPDKVVRFFETISSLEKARAISRLDKESKRELFKLLSSSQAAQLLHELPDEQAAHLIEQIPALEATNILDNLPEHERADILSDLSDDDADAIIRSMPKDEAIKTRQLLQYPEDTAGGIMSTEFLVYSEMLTVNEVIADLRENSEKYSDYNVQYAYIISNDEKLTGVLRLRDLLLSQSTKKVKDIMRMNPLSVRVNTSLEQLIAAFEGCHFLGIPVIDSRGQLKGIVKRYEVMEAAGDREKDTYLKTSGIIGGEELRSMPILTRAGRRLSWLSVNIILNIFAASVIAFYQDTLSAVIALAVFLPIISDMSGCSGNQAVAVSIRELTLGVVKPVDIYRVLLKECGVGIMNGIILGLLLGLVAFLWKGNLYLGLVVGGALAMNTVVAVCLGGMIPLLLMKFNKDPALASGPILTTVTDMCGFFFALGFAAHFLPLLT